MRLRLFVTFTVLWLACLWLAPALGGDWYVAPAGSDRNDGSHPSRPFRTWQAAIDLAEPGDVVHLAPGIYPVSGSGAAGVSITRNGTRHDPIRLLGNRAVLDCASMSNPGGVTCLRLSADWWIISGIAVTNAPQNSEGAWTVGMQIIDASNNHISNSRAYRNAGPGFSVTGASRNNHLIFCKSYNNFDPLSNPPGGNADGFQITQIPLNATGNRITSSIASSNSDDGYDLWRAEAPVTLEHSTAIKNGFPAEGDGVGFKLGENRSGPRHIVRYNRALNNRCEGFASNNASGPARMVGNTSIGYQRSNC